MIVRVRPFSNRGGRPLAMSALFIAVVVGTVIYGQLQQSGGPGSTVTLQAGSAIAGKFGIDQTTPGTTNGVQVNAALPAGTNIVGKFGVDQTTPGTTNGVVINSGTVTAVTSITNALPAGTNVIGHVINDAGTANLGFVRTLPSSCTQSTNFTNSTVQVATGAGTTVTSTTTCVTFAFANNITNSAVTLRLADKQATPVIWLGGNADFSIPANSNIRIPLEGVTFTSGITAIAGTASAINLQINGVQ